MNEKRGPLYLLTGVIIGAVIGVVVSLWILPVSYTQTEPSTLRTDQRELFRSMVARAFLVEADVNRAKARLNLLQDAAPVEDLIAQAQNLLATSGDQVNARAMALLAASFSQSGAMITPLPGVITPVQAAPATITPSPSLPTVTSTLSVTATQGQATSTPPNVSTPRPSATAQPTQGSPFQLISNDSVCSSPASTPLLMVYVQDAQGNPLPGVKIEITLVNAAPAYFYTGLYPEISLGYADYKMQKDALYSLRVGDGGQLVTGLQAPLCDANGSSYSGSLKLVFKQP